SGLTTVVSTPYMDEADRCDRVALIQRGRILAIDTPEAIARSFDRPLFGVRAADRYRALLALRDFRHTHTVYPFGELLHYTDARVDIPAEQIGRELRGFLEAKGVAQVVVEPTPPTIEDSFMARMGVPEGEEAA
ncbi:MAG: ABC transporter ATP-binding protein, partial [Gemmatimonadales bacterium]